MSKIPYTIDIDRFICSELEDIRKMRKTLDFSGLHAAIERIQSHANAMESAVYKGRDFRYDIRNAIKDKDMSEKEFRQKIEDLYKEYFKDDQLD